MRTSISTSISTCREYGPRTSRDRVDARGSSIGVFATKRTTSTSLHGSRALVTHYHCSVNSHPTNTPEAMASSEPPELAPRAMEAREVINASYNLRVHDLREHVDKEFDEIKNIKNEILDITSKQTKQIAKQTDQLAKLREDFF